ncbi:MAG: Na+/H+ antiporter subunit E [Firmicutes bacterium]|jgi:multicomponent Na+:H+ antiporter subunit E|nr:Na+/H+ antiporter subunit E [Bacillota bacterium]
MKHFKGYGEFIVLFLFWLLLMGKISVFSVVSGMIVSELAVVFSNFIFSRIDTVKVKYINIFVFGRFILNVFLEIFIAAYYHILRIITADEVSVIFDIRLDIFDEMAIILISNAITLTPGTMTVQVSGNTLTVAAFIKDEEDIEYISERILRKFQKPFIDGGLR